MNVRRALLGVALAAGLFTAGPTRAAESTDTADTTGTSAAAENAPARSYRVYVPTGEHQPGRPLVVFLHGCLQTAAQAQSSSHFDDVADREGFVVVYPEQNLTPNQTYPFSDGNGMRCWNWFHPDHQKRGQGEPAAIAAITRKVMADQEIDPQRVYVGGLSAGADMSVILAAAYPDLYAAAGAVEGCAYATCADATGRLAYEQMGARARVVPMITVQGTADTLNNVAMGRTVVHSWLGTDDWADDGEADNSIDRVPDATTHDGFEELAEAKPGSGDACVRNSNWPCPGGVLGLKRYPTTVNEYHDGAGCSVLDEWIVHLMEHGQPNAQPSDGPFTDPLGPDITTPMWEFFKRHTLGGRCAS